MSLFGYRNPYDTEKTEKNFWDNMKKNFIYHYVWCKAYRLMISAQGWDAERIIKVSSVKDIPFMSTAYLKHHKMRSVPLDKPARKKVSETGGQKSAFDFEWNGLGMSLSMGKVHKLRSLRPCHYIILGYEPKIESQKGKKNRKKAVAEAAYGFSCFAPAKSRTYALKNVNGEYKLDLDDIKDKLTYFMRGRTPVRIIGAPFLAYLLLDMMKEKNVRYILPKNSMIAFGGGRKEYYTPSVDKKTLYRLAEEVLGISEDRCMEFFKAVEHPVLYCSCPKHHFHVPVYSRVIIRDVDTFEPVENGTPGLVNLVTPMVNSAPMLSIMTDDLGILHDGAECGCGIETPYLEILGRVGAEDIPTYAEEVEKLDRNMLGEV